MNERAKTDYENACVFRDLALQAADAGDVNLAIAWTGISNVTVELAKFAAAFHPIVAGIDEDFPDVSQPTQSGPKVWGRAPSQGVDSALGVSRSGHHPAPQKPEGFESL